MYQLGIIDIVLMIVSVIIIVLVAMQNPKQGLGDALTGGSSELFKNQKERGAEAYIVRATYIATGIFLAVGIIIWFFL